MTNHTMKLEQIPGALGTQAGYVLCFATMGTAAAVADDDVLVFKNVKKIIPINIVSEIGSLIDFDASAASSNDWNLTVNTTVLTTGTAASYVEGLVLAKF